jgi:adenine/guanine phosphoribosyltransferase-like PRPP-binding protein
MVTCSVAVVVVGRERVTEVNEGSVVVVVDDILDSGPV